MINTKFNYKSMRNIFLKTFALCAVSFSLSLCASAQDDTGVDFKGAF